MTLHKVVFFLNLPQYAARNIQIRKSLKSDIKIQHDMIGVLCVKVYMYVLLGRAHKKCSDQHSV